LLLTEDDGRGYSQLFAPMQIEVTHSSNVVF
jgi:hypothetical protein